MRTLDGDRIALDALRVGAPGAPVTVVEFADFGCPWCARFALETLPALRAELVEAGRVRWRVVPFVLGSFPNGGEAFRAAACVAEQGGALVWPMHDRLFGHATEWKASLEPEALLRPIAVEAGADGAPFDACLEGPGAADREAAAGALAGRMGVPSTPTFFVNGKLVQGALPLAAFRQVLEDAGA